MMQHGKKHRAAAQKIDKNKVYSLEEAVKLMKENKLAKFDESVEVHIKTNVDPKKGEQQVRGTVALPHGTGKTKRVAVITSTSEKEAKEAGADIVGGEELIEKFAKKIDFDVLVATPEMMPKLAKVAKILGPKGLMPNPKTETVTTKIKEAVEALKKGRAAFKNDDSANVHQAVGKLSFEDAKLIENIKVFIEAIEKAKPAAFKGKLITNITVCSTMGNGIKISL
ncbi:MAG: 50S ribosomal protein L1 [Candidatus Moranbacteria bacterium CG23_combo_of_CG06-09_8_20_14_all_39_10]|nr:MAG: 50S ribosomal protein L1 [Candidatus Moranbacteria bacterium CG23_combo_of_CG06-09_8_20_14_all_39_10]